MAILSKPTSLEFTCYELGHTWTPSCKQATADVVLEVFKQGLMIYGPLYLIAGLLRKKGKEYFKKKIIQETALSTTFLTTNGSLFITFFCLWRKITGFYFYLNAILCGIPACALALSIERKDRKLLGRLLYISTAFLPAVMASYCAILVERKSRRGLLAIYMANVATETAYRMVVSRGWLKPVKNGEVILFSVASAIYLYLFKKNSLTPSIISAFRYLVGKDELPRAVLDEEGPPLRRYKKSGILKHISENKIVKQVIEWINQTPKHRLCYHDHSCLHYTLQGFVRMFCCGYVIQGGVKLLSSISRILRQPSALLHALTHSDNLHLGAFLGCFVAIYRLVNCLLRWVRDKDESLHGLLAGFLAGWSMMWYKSSTLALYTCYKLAEVLYFKGIAKGIVPYIKCADTIIYSISTAFVFHVAVLEPHNLRPAYWKFLCKVTGNRFAVMNRKILEPFVPNAAKMFPDFWPDYDSRYTNLTPADIGKNCCSS